MEKFNINEEIEKIKLEDKMQLIIEKENFDNKILQYALYNNDMIKDDVGKILNKYKLSEIEKNKFINSLLKIIQKYKDAKHF